MHYYCPIQSYTVTLTLIISDLTDPFAASRQYLGETTRRNSETEYRAEAAFQHSTDSAILLYHQKFNTSQDAVAGVYRVYKSTT